MVIFQAGSTVVYKTSNGMDVLTEVLSYNTESGRYNLKCKTGARMEQIPPVPEPPVPEANVAEDSSVLAAGGAAASAPDLSGPGAGVTSASAPDSSGLGAGVAATSAPDSSGGPPQPEAAAEPMAVDEDVARWIPTCEAQAVIMSKYSAWQGKNIRRQFGM